MCSPKWMVAVEDGFGVVAECHCGTLHLSVGPVSVALDREGLERLHSLTEVALRQLASTPEPELPSHDIPVHHSRLH